jgi:hypothetical protein
MLTMKIKNILFKHIHAAVEDLAALFEDELAEALDVPRELPLERDEADYEQLDAFCAAEADPKDDPEAWLKKIPF